ncbi:hypothetical protein Bwad001_43190 [Bilophila wadsworthia]|jgi:hypothetical protein|uniref:hypothetical protein n=1 Tax=Bilophila wadsworthia TaxID=35833 RepID=UPI000497A1B4|nr:hypothetical protein [Bilophila wadsworthia]
MEQQIQEKKEAMTTEEKRILRIKQLKAKLQKEQARLSASKRKERDGQLISFGVYIEEFFKSSNEDARKRLEESIKTHLKDRNLERALAGLKRLSEEEETRLKEEKK